MEMVTATKLTKNQENLSNENNEEEVMIKEIEGEEIQFGAPRSILDKYVYMDKAKELLNIAFHTGTNTIFFGAGGHGKSELTADFFKEKGITPYVITMGSGMSTDRLFGGLDLPVFDKTGKIEYLLDNSFMNHEYVIFEELFDAPDFILEQLKDILSAKVYRNGSQIYPLKTKLIICNTNRKREDFMKNASLSALMERFPLELEVKWKDYNRMSYEHLLNTVLGGANPLLTYILERFSQKGFIISPRIAIKSAQLVDECGPDCLQYIADFKVQEALLKDSLAGFQSIYKMQSLTIELQKICQELDSMNIPKMTNVQDIKKATELNNKLRIAIKEINRLKSDDSLVNEKARIVSKFEKLQEDYKDQLYKLTSLTN
jgi:MoxR-like ATPase